MENEDYFLPFACPNPECGHQFDEFPTRDEREVMTCPACGDGFRLRIETPGGKTIEELSENLPEGGKIKARWEIQEKSP